MLMSYKYEQVKIHIRFYIVKQKKVKIKLFQQI